MGKQMLFNRNPLTYAGTIEQPSQHLVKTTPGLWNASLEDAARYGGELTREALGAMTFRNDRKYITVDTKIHMLKPGMWTAMPGWHTDGTPRGGTFSPSNGRPNILLQEGADAVSPRYHLLVTGMGCLTDFVTEPFEWTPWLHRMEFTYRDLSAAVDAAGLAHVQIPSCHVVEWDWWDIHRGVQAKLPEWRFLIRVTESDYLPPQKDPRDFIRTQSQVYVLNDTFDW